MSVYEPSQKKISAGHLNYDCMKNCILSFSQPDSNIDTFDIQCIFYYTIA